MNWIPAKLRIAKTEKNKNAPAMQPTQTVLKSTRDIYKHNLRDLQSIW
jgi:hypothetical protein